MDASAQDERIRLPSPTTRGTVSVEEVLSRRGSVRTYTQDSLTMEEVSQLVWAAQGVTRIGLGRTAPSAGATYPLDIYVVANRVEALKPGVYRYLPEKHCLVLEKPGRFGKVLRGASLGQEMVEQAAVNIVVTAVTTRTTGRYGDRGRRYVHMEVGHVGQNVYLQAEAMGLGTVAVGAFRDDEVKTLLGVNGDVLYIMPVGHPK